MKISRGIAASHPLATTAMHGRVEAFRNEGMGIIDFSIAISHFPPPVTVLDAVTRAVQDERTMPYTGVAGALDVRRSLCTKLERENGVQAAAGEIIVTNGAKQALYEALYPLTDPGDRVLIFKPHWPAYVTTCLLLGLTPVLVDLPDTITPALLAACPPADLVMMGWRLGFALAPLELVQAMQTLQGPITAAASHLAQVATVAAFDCGPQVHMIDEYRERRDNVLRHLAEVPWIAMACPDSGPYLWGDVRALTHDTEGFAEALLAEEGVAIMPGDALGVPGFIRIGYIGDDTWTLMEGVRRLVAFGDRLAAAR